MRVIRLLALAAILALPTLRASADELRYQIQPIVRVGATVGDVLIPPDLNLLVARLNDNGQILFVPRDVTAEKPTWMIQYTGGSFITIGGPGKEAPIGQWPEGVAFNNLIGMNQSGNVAFVVHRYGDPAGASLGSFLWDYQKRQVTTVIQKGMPAVNDLLFENGGSHWIALNNLGDIVLVAAVKNAAGKAADGIFFVGRDGKILPIALPDQVLPDGRKMIAGSSPSISDAGVIAFRAATSGTGVNSAYVWEQGTITPVALVGQAAPGGGRIEDVSLIFVNNKNRNVMLATTVRGMDALYLFKDGALKPVAVPRQEMPGGGRFLERLGGGVSPGSEAGEYAFTALLQDDTTAAYRVDIDGNLSLVLKSGMRTALGTVTSIGPIGVAINSKGQVVLPVQIDDGPETLVLLTPVAP